MKPNGLYLAASAAFLAAGTFSATAADVTPPASAPEAAAPVEATQYPYIEGTLDLELGNNFAFSSDDPGAEINDLYLEGWFGVKLGLTPIFSINGGVTLEEVLDPEPFEDRYFEDEGIYVDTLNLQADIGAATFIAGKFEPVFGKAWDDAPGVFGTDFAEDYELSEQIGLGASYRFETAGYGVQTVSGGVFYADQTVLSESILNNRGRTRTLDGGAGNTGSFDNFMVSLGGEEMPALKGFSYLVAYRHLSAGFGDVSDEDGYVLNLEQEIALANEITLGLIGEVAYFDGYGGTGDDALYATAGVGLKRGHWHGELSGTIRQFDFAAGGSQTDHLAQVSAGYEFDNGFDVSLGYGVAKADDITTHAVGLRLTKSFGFSTRN